MKEHNGHFIVCEGLDCSGKTSAIKYAMNKLREEGYKVVYSKGLEPNDFVKTFFKGKNSAFSLLSGLQYIDNTVVKPELNSKKIVLQDRWYHSILAYDTRKRKTSEQKLLEKTFIPALSQPDALVYFSVSLEERIARLKQSAENSYHLQKLKNPQKIAKREKNYLEQYNSFTKEQVMINTTKKSVEESRHLLYLFIKTYLQKQK